MKYVINKTYDFGAWGSGGASTVPLKVRMGSVKACEYGDYFLNNPLTDLEIPVGNKFKNILDQSEAKSIAKSLYHDRECSRDTLDDFYDAAWELLGELYYYYTWSEEFINDCIAHYKKTMLAKMKRRKYDCYGVGYHAYTGDDKWVKLRLSFDQLYALGESYASVEEIDSVSIDVGTKDEIGSMIYDSLNYNSNDYDAYFPAGLIRQAKSLYLDAQKYM